MKTILNRIATCALNNLAGRHRGVCERQKETVNFPTDIKVNGTVVSSGTFTRLSLMKALTSCR